MRRPAAALLGTLAGTVLLVGAKYGSTSPPADTGAVASSDDAAGAPASDPAAVLDASGAPTASAAPAPSALGTTQGAAPGTPGAGRTTNAPAPTTAAACTTASGGAAQIASPGVGTVTVTIQVCGGALKTASAVQSKSNWDRNTAAIPALNSLAVTNYKTNFAAIHYSRATLTSQAYQASLRSAMSKAGI
ncbi:hypothetical protein [Dactylosporangium sp. NPDC048998]|uniref:hypothetical protein n=1 Tax=Dactylosporangium sp. NPDC048998 TaxID=3363976 RepID=UPI003719C2F9